MRLLVISAEIIEERITRPTDQVGHDVARAKHFGHGQGC